METERVSAPSHDQNFIEKVRLFLTREDRWAELPPEIEKCLCVSLKDVYRFYQLSVKSVIKKGKRRNVIKRFHTIS